jgi:hypothetical protein
MMNATTIGIVNLMKIAHRRLPREVSLWGTDGENRGDRATQKRDMVFFLWH